MRRTITDRIGPYNAILMYHSVGGDLHDHMPAVRFREDVKYLSEEYEIVDLPAAVASPTPEKKVAITFDDAYSDFVEHALPVLREFDAPATVFVISEAVFDDEFVHDEEYEYEYVSPEQLRDLVDDPLVTVGNHTRTHPDLTTLSDRGELEDEIVGAKRDLERELSTRITRFAYPHHRYDDEAIDVVSRSHEYAVAGDEWDVLSLRNANPCRLPRINGAIDRPRLESALTDRSMILRHLGHRGRRFVPRLSTA